MGKTFGARLRAGRLRKNWSGPELAKLLGIGANYLYVVERDEKSFSMKTTVRAAEVLELELSELIEGKRRSRRR